MVQIEISIRYTTNGRGDIISNHKLGVSLNKEYDTYVRQMKASGLSYLSYTDFINIVAPYWEKDYILNHKEREKEGMITVAKTAVGLAMTAATIYGIYSDLKLIKQVYFGGRANAVGFKGAGNLRPQALMDDLAKSGVKYNPNDVVMVTKTPDGKLLWLENGTNSAGLKHIVNGHATNFADKGITNIPSFLNQTLQNTPINTGMGAGGPFADYLINGSTYRVAYGTNGFIVSFYPIN